jgi:hypothetical protein
MQDIQVFTVSAGRSVTSAGRGHGNDGLEQFMHCCNATSPLDALAGTSRPRRGGRAPGQGEHGTRNSTGWHRHAADFQMVVGVKGCGRFMYGRISLPPFGNNR